MEAYNLIPPEELGKGSHIRLERCERNRTFTGKWLLRWQS